MSETGNHTNSKFRKSFYGYNQKQVDEYIYQLLTYCWNLAEENMTLRKDLSFYSKQTHLQHTSDVVSASWEEKEYSMLLGLELQEDLRDYQGNLVAGKSTVITSHLIESLIAKGLYGELIAAADPRKGADQSAR